MFEEALDGRPLQLVARQAHARHAQRWLERDHALSGMNEPNQSDQNPPDAHEDRTGRDKLAPGTDRVHKSTSLFEY